MAATAVAPTTRLWLRRMPWLTLAVLVVTARRSIAEVGVGGLLTDLERAPAGMHGQWRRPARRFSMFGRR